MSRIAGFVLPVGYSKSLLENMLQSVQEEASEWKAKCHLDSNSGVGYIGISDYHDYKDQDVSVVLDGYIYNYKDFGDSSNFSKIFAQLYKKFGFTKALNLINGDFSIAVYDEKAKEMWLARDRFGVRPMYYIKDHSGFAFASRIKSFYAIDNVNFKEDPNYVARFAGAHYRYIDNDPAATPFKNVKQLPAAHYLHFKNGGIKIGAYWSLSEQAELKLSEEELAEQYKSLLYDACKIRYDVAINPAFTLSGGMDSSSVLASVRKQTDTKQQAYSTVYVDKTYDESDEIKTMLEQNVEHWHRVEVGSPDIFSLIEKMVTVHDEPVATATWLSHFILCEKAKQNGVGALFGGLGGDELNAGEYEYFFLNFADLVKAGKNDEFHHEVKKWVEYHDHPIFRKNLGVAKDGLTKMVDLNINGQCLPEKTRLLRYAETLNLDYFDLGKFEPTMKHPFESYLKNRTYQDIFYETAPCCLRAEDRQTMAFGIENFVPFFDHRLVEFMFRVPGHFKIHNGVTKVLARKAMSGTLPDETRNRIVKTGWNAPAHQWFSGSGLEKLKDLIHSTSFRQRGVYDLNTIEKLMVEHEDIVKNNLNKENHMMFFWQLVNLESWFKSCVDLK